MSKPREPDIIIGDESTPFDKQTAALCRLRVKYDELKAEAEKLSSTLSAISDADLEACVMPKVVMYGINKVLKDWQAFKEKMK